MKLTVVVATMLCVVAWLSSESACASSLPQATVACFVGPASTSPNSSAAQQSIMSFMDTGWSYGHINRDVANNPAALNMPCCLRACDIIFTPASLYMWDGTNQPTGNFRFENGKRLLWAYDWKCAESFYATNIYFSVWSSDSAKAFNYSSNIAVSTTTGLPLTYSPTLRGELWDGNGNITASYYRGENISSNKVNRVFGLIRTGWIANDMNGVVLDLIYFRQHMTPDFRVSAAFYEPGGSGFTNSISSRPCLLGLLADPGTNMLVVLQGQRRYEGEMSYGLERTLALNDTNFPWVVISASGLRDGAIHTCLPTDVGDSPKAFFRAFEVDTQTMAGSIGVPKSGPVVIGSNDSE